MCRILPDDIDGSGGSPPTPLLLLPGPPNMVDGSWWGPFGPPPNILFGFEVWIGGVGIGRCGVPEGPFGNIPGPPRPFICPGWGDIPGPSWFWWLLRIELPPFIGPQLGPDVDGIPFGKHCEWGGIPFGICGSFKRITFMFKFNDMALSRYWIQQWQCK